jgi:hypothetical protein
MDTTTIIASSDDSSSFFPTNTPRDFISLFGKPIEFNSPHKVGLKQVILELKNIVNPNLKSIVVDIFLSSISGTILNGAESTLLKRAILHSRQNSHIFFGAWDFPDLVFLRPDYLDRLEVSIRPVILPNESVLDLKSSQITLQVVKSKV